MSKHQIVHVEFSAKDQGEAGEFYSDLFGWDIDYVEEMKYSTFSTGDGIGGGLNPVGDNNPAGTVLVYVGTDDIDATLKKAENLGGKITGPKSEVPGFGWFGFFEDPSGNTVGLWTDLKEE